MPIASPEPSPSTSPRPGLSSPSGHRRHGQAPHGASGDAARLDAAIVRRGLAPTRSKAQRLIKDGKVSVDHRAVAKASMMVGPDADISIVGDDHYVSRGAYKLAAAFDAFRPHGLPSPQGLRCLDIGASTGGFCDVLLRAGAARVIALDVGHGQLDPIIRDDPRIMEMSGVNIRNVQDGDLAYRPQMVVSDVSFISLTHVIPVIARIAEEGAHIVLLVKPQFEVGRNRLGRHGIVDDPELRAQALRTVGTFADAHGLRVVATCDSPIEGSMGNREYLLYARFASLRPSS